MTSTNRRLPDIFLVGAPKAGTTSLADWLAQHCDVYFSVPKEPFHWASDYPGMRAHYGFDSPASYAKLFSSDQATAAQHRAEGSTNYLYSQRAVPDILAAIDNPKFIVSLRKPVDLLVSYHRTQLLALNEDEKDFATAWRRSVDGGQPQISPLDPKLVEYPLVGSLGAAVERLLGLAPRESVHFVVFDDLAADPARTWAELTGFLGLTERPGPTFSVRNASTKTYRSAALRRLTHSPPAILAAPMRSLRQWSRTTSHPLPARIKAKMWRSERRPEVDPAILAEVAQFLSRDTRRLGELIGRDLSDWATVPAVGPRRD